MALILDALTVRGWGPHPPERAITLKFGGGGPTAVVGPNGSGKSSTIAGALTWCLFGQAPATTLGESKRNPTKSLFAGHHETEVIAWFVRQSDSVVFQVTRHRAGGSSGTLKIEQFAVRGAPSSPLTWEEVFGHGLTYDLFVRTCVRGQGDPWRFAEVTDGRKREILDELSGAGELEERLATAKAWVTELKARLTAAEIAEKARAVMSETVRNAVASAHERAEKWEVDRKSRLDFLSAVATAKRPDAAAQAANRARWEQRASEWRAHAAHEPAEPPELVPLQAAASDANFRAAHAQAALDGLTRQLHQHTELAVGSPCTWCGQVVQPDAPVAVRRGLLEGEIALARSKAGAAYVEASNRLAEAQRARAEFYAALDGWRARRLALDPGPEPATTEQLTRELAMIEAEHASLLHASNPYTAELEEWKAAQAREATLLAVEQELTKLYREDLGIAELWAEALGPKGARARLSEEVLLAIETSASDWLSALSDGRLRVHFESQRTTQAGVVREEIQTVVESVEPSGRVTTRDLVSFSGGERARINFAVDLAVASVAGRQGGVPISLLVLDETVFSGLDATGKAAMARALHRVGIADVVVIDHDPRLSEVQPTRVGLKPDHTVVQP